MKPCNNLLSLKRMLLVAVIILSIFSVGCSKISMSTEFEKCKLYYSEQKFSDALKPCKKSAVQGYSIAQYKLATMYYDGKGVTIDLQEKLLNGFKRLHCKGILLPNTN